MSDPGARAADIAVLDIERLIRRIYQQASDEIVDKMNEHLEKYKAKDREWEQRVADGQATEREWQLWRKGQMFTGKRWLNLQRKCTGMMLFANQKANAIVEGKRLGVFAENINYQNFCFDRDSGYSLGIDFTLYDEHTVDRLIRDRPELLPRREVDGKKDMAWNRVKISNAVTQSILQGDSIDDLAKRIGRTTGITNKSAMLRYARTAMTGAQNGGRIEAMEQAQAVGINVRKKWIATLDAKTRDAHQHLDGEVQEVDKPFKSSLGDIMYPGDPTADPANVYNCRCTLGYDYPEYSTAGLRRAYNNPDSRESEVVEDQTYREWKERKESRLTPELLHSQSIDQNPEDGFKRKPISKQLFNQITKPVVEAGGQVIVGGEEVIKHLMDMDAYSSQIGDILMFRPDATVSDVVEEVFHFWQERRGDYNDYLLEERIILREIDAKKHLIKVAKRYRIPSEETELTRRELEKYERDLQAWRETH